MAPNVTYTPAANYNGPDSFTFKANDGTVDSAVATVSVTVTPVNDAPVAINDTYTTSENTTLTVAVPGVLTNDTDIENNALNVLLVSPPAHGALSLNVNGSFTYTPTASFNGTDSFTYRASDGQTTSTIATATITVVHVNVPPIVNAGSNQTITLQPAVRMIA